MLSKRFKSGSEIYFRGIHHESGLTDQIKALKKDFDSLNPSIVFIEESSNTNVDNFYQRAKSKIESQRNERDWLVIWAKEKKIKIVPMMSSYRESVERMLSARNVKEPLLDFIAMHTYMGLFDSIARMNTSKSQVVMENIISSDFCDQKGLLDSIGQLKNLELLFKSRNLKDSCLRNAIQILNAYGKSRGYKDYLSWLEKEKAFDSQHIFVAPYPYDSKPSNILAKISFVANNENIRKTFEKFKVSNIIFAVVGQAHFEATKESLDF